MLIEIIIVAVLFLIALFYTKTISVNKFIEDNNEVFNELKEKDYDFLVAAKHGEQVNANQEFSKRVKTALYSLVIFTIVFAVQASVTGKGTGFSFINFIFVLLLAFLVFKAPYNSLKSYYKRYMTKIDQQLPYYLKSLEILCQNYTVPVALSRSIETAPEIFKPGLRQMIAKIDAGDSSIDPYMEFAQQYPVRDSMRMMRLLYRLGLGAQENKYQQLIMFSRSVSSLQNKAREDKYVERLGNMEKRTMIMLVVTGGGTMVILLLSVLFMFGA